MLILSQVVFLLGPREQLNQPTHWLDGSMIYGGNTEEVEELRDHSDPGRRSCGTTLTQVRGAKGPL